MSSVMEFIDSSITPELTSSLATRFAVSPEAAASALETSSLAMLTTIAARASEQDFAFHFDHLLANSNIMTASAPAGSTAASSSTASSEFLSQVFGGQLSNAQAKIAESASIPTSAAGGIMMAAAPIVMSSLAHKVKTDGLSVASLGAALTAELPGFRPTLRTHVTPADDDKGEAEGWLWTLLLVGILFVAGMVWFFSVNTDTTVNATAATATNVTGLGAFFQRKLPNGVDLNIPQNGIESKLVAFIEDSSKPVDTTTWFDFDRLLFSTGSATLEPTSAEQLTNIANILKAYPKVSIRLGGYTDNTGDPAANLKLSEDRAANVMAELAKLGVEPSRMDAKGYGEEHPVADNATEAGRAQNRRISLRVTEK